MSHDYAYWHLGCVEPTPLVVIANASEGPWMAQRVPVEMPDLPVQFFCVRKGVFGPVLPAAGLELFRDDLLDALGKLSIDGFFAWRAAIRPPQSDEVMSEYSVVRVPETIPLAAVGTAAGRPVLCALEEGGGALVSSELRSLLERFRIPGLEFYEPVLLGSP